MVVEKRIMDVALEIEMSTFKENGNEGLALPSGAAAPILMPSKIQIFFIITKAVPLYGHDNIQLKTN